MNLKVFSILPLINFILFLLAIPSLISAQYAVADFIVLNDEMDANNHMNTISMTGVINSSFYTPFKRPRVERNIMSIASYVSVINYDLYGFATPDLNTLRDNLKVPKKFVVVSGQTA